MNSAIQPKIQATPAFTESFDRTAAYRLRTAALRRHLIQERILLADGARSRSASDANAMRAPAANDADAAMVALPVRPSFNFAPGDHPFLYRTAGLRDLIAVVSKWIARVVRESFDVWCRCREARAMHRGPARPRPAHAA